MLLKQPYDSKTLKNFSEAKLTLLINRYIINDYAYITQSVDIKPTDFVKDGIVLKPVILYGASAEEADIPELEFPIINNDRGWICFDMRKFYSVDRRTKAITPKSSFEFDFARLKNVLSGLWSVGFIKEMYQFTYPQAVFARWLSNVIGDKHGLKLDAKIIEIMALIYYSRLFSDDTTRANDELMKLKIRLSDMNYSPGLLEDVYSKTLEMNTLDDFCDLLYEVTGNVRLKDFNANLLIRLISTSWIGMNYRTFIALSLEYPPIFIAMAYFSVESNIYRKSIIGLAADSVGKRGKREEFVDAINKFITINHKGA